jgi:hypothetical protein
MSETKPETDEDVEKQEQSDKELLKKWAQYLDLDDIDGTFSELICEHEDEFLDLLQQKRKSERQKRDNVWKHIIDISANDLDVICTEVFRRGKENELKTPQKLITPNERTIMFFHLFIEIIGETFVERMRVNNIPLTKPKELGVEL